MLEIDKGSVSYLELCLLVTVTLVLDGRLLTPFSEMMEVKSELSEGLPTSSPEPRALSSPVPESCPPPLQPDANEVLSFLQWLASGLCVYRQTPAAVKP